MPQVTVYIRQEDLDAWRAIEHKSQFLHDAIHGTVIGKDFETKRDVENFVVPRVEAEVDEPELEYNPYENLILDTVAGGVFDTVEGERVDADPEMVKELKRRGQTR